MPENRKQEWTETLPDALPENPMQVLAEWLAEARSDRAQPNPNAMVLATVDAAGRPAARVVLCKDIDIRTGSIMFYTNYESRKGRELAANPAAAIVFHWDHRHRQVRAEGHVERLPPAASDAYFATRPWRSQLGAWASVQSKPVASRQALLAAVDATAQRLGLSEHTPATLPRPASWGGFQLNVRALELWVEGEHRVHDRARWTRTSEASPAVWTSTRLQP